MPKTGVSVGLVLLGVAGAMLSGCGGTEKTADVPPSQLTVGAPSREFDEANYQDGLNEARRSDRSYDVDATVVPVGGGEGEQASVSREFDARGVTLDYLEARRLDRSSIVMEVSSSESSFNYEEFIARLTELRAQQRSGNFVRSSSASPAASRTGNSLRDLPKYPLDTVFNRSSRSSSSNYSGRSFLNRSSSSVSSAGSSASSVAECGDGKDNDGDGTVDAEDPQCHTDGNGDYLPSYDYRRPSESRSVTQGNSSSAPGIATHGTVACADRSIIPALGDGAFSGDEGATFPYLLNGDCPVSAAILPAWGQGGTVFGSLEF